MEQVVQQIIGGLATGAIYACIALSIVMIYQAIDHLNFAQGEMAMFSTYIAWQLIQWGMPYWGAFFLTIAISFVLGYAIERTVFKPVHNAPVLSHIVIFIALEYTEHSWLKWVRDIAIYGMLLATALSGLQYLWRAFLLFRKPASP